MSKVSICSAALALDVQLCTSSEEARYYLRGFGFQKHPQGGAYLVSTDGHRMAVFHDPAAVVAEDCIVALDKAFLSKAKGRCTYPLFVYIDHSAGRGMAYLAGAIGDDETLPEDLNKLPGLLAICHNVLIDATYPDWKAVFPSDVTGKEPTQPCAAYNPKYLGDFAKLGLCIEVICTDASAPAVILIGARPDFVGVVMPIRGHNAGVPSWLFPKAPRAKAQQAAE